MIMDRKNIIVTIEDLTLNMRGAVPEDYSLQISFAGDVILDQPIDRNMYLETKKDHEIPEDPYLIQGILEYDSSEISSLVDHPLIVKIFNTTVQNESDKVNNPEVKSIESPVYNCLGVVDILPIFLGESEIHTTCRLEPLSPEGQLDLLAWAELPCVNFMLRAEENSLGSISDLGRSSSLATLTVESAYGLPELELQDGTKYECCVATIMAKQDSENLSKILYTNGVSTKSPIFDEYKKWATLEGDADGSVLSNAMMARGEAGLTNDVNLNISPYFLELKLHQEHHWRIQWNAFHRFLVDEKQGRFINRHRCWPVELLVVASAHRSNINARKPVIIVHAMALPDVSKLLEAGERRIRLATPLYEYDKDLILGLTGFETMYTDLPSIESSDRRIITNSGMEITNGEEKHQLTQIINDEGSPAFIVLEIEFDHPLVAVCDDFYLRGRLCTKHLPPTLGVSVDESSADEGGCGQFRDAAGRAATELRKATERFQHEKLINENSMHGDSWDCARRSYLRSSGTEAKVLAALGDPTAHLLAEYKEEELSKTYARMSRQIRMTLGTTHPAIDSADSFYGFS